MRRRGAYELQLESNALGQNLFQTRLIFLLTVFCVCLMVGWFVCLLLLVVVLLTSVQRRKRHFLSIFLQKKNLSYSCNNILTQICILLNSRWYFLAYVSLIDHRGTTQADLSQLITKHPYMCDSNSKALHRRTSHCICRAANI